MGARHRKPAMIGAGAMLAVAAVAGGIFAFSGTDSPGCFLAQKH